MLRFLLPFADVPPRPLQPAGVEIASLPIPVVIAMILGACTALAVMIVLWRRTPSTPKTPSPGR